jgi:lactoylglutathione lyase
VKSILRGIYETHVEVSELERSIEYYRSLGLALGSIDSKRRAAFLYLYGEQTYMVGLWEKSQVYPRHFAFRVHEADADGMFAFLEQRGIRPAFGFSEVMASPRGPHAHVYFHDPDGNELELVAKLTDTPRPELDVRWLPLSEWRAMIELVPFSRRKSN